MRHLHCYSQHCAANKVARAERYIGAKCVVTSAAQEARACPGKPCSQTVPRMAEPARIPEMEHVVLRAAANVRVSHQLPTGLFTASSAAV